MEHPQIKIRFVQHVINLGVNAIPASAAETQAGSVDPGSPLQAMSIG
jgi:hypothetical protein